MDKLFTGICDIKFTFQDGSEFLCQTTLNADILKQHGYSMIDGMIDLISGRVIPEEMFLADFAIGSKGEFKLSPLDSIFNIGGKAAWSMP